MEHGLFERHGARVGNVPRYGHGDVLLQLGTEYARVGTRRLELDIARPARGSGPFPLLLVFPGNGWGCFFWFDRRACRKEILEAASRGYVAAAVDYRPAITDGFEAGLHDAHCALEWLRTHAAELHADSRRTALTGFSSGGQLALLLGLNETAGPTGRCAVRAIVATAAPSDMRVFEGRPLLGAVVRRLFGGGSERIPERYRRASPAAIVRSDMPPSLILHGQRDRFVPVEQSLILDRALSRSGVCHQLRLSADRGHRDQWRDPAVWEFLSRNLRT